METAVAKATSPAEMVIASLKEKGITKTMVDQMAGYADLKVDAKIEGETVIYNKEQYNEVHEARMKVRNTRILIAKECKSMRDVWNALCDENRSKELEFLSVLTPVEKHLQEQEGSIDHLKAKVAEDKTKREEERLQTRIQKLNEFGGKFDGYNMTAYSVSIDKISLSVIDDEKFEAILLEAKTAHEAEQKRIADEEAQRKAEAEKLAAERAELDKLRKEQEEREAAIRAEQEKVAKEQAEREAKIQAEQEAIEKQKREAEEAKAREIAAKKREEELEAAKKEAAETARKEAEAKAKRDAEEKAEKERKAAEAAAKREARKPDAKKIQDHIHSLQAVAIPVLKDEAMQMIVTDLWVDINDAIKLAEGKITDRLR